MKPDHCSRCGSKLDTGDFKTCEACRKYKKDYDKGVYRTKDLKLESEYLERKRVEEKYKVWFSQCETTL